MSEGTETGFVKSTYMLLYIYRYIYIYIPPANVKRLP